MKLTANTLTIILLVYAGMLQPKLTGRARHHSELSRDAHDVSTSGAMQAAARNAVVASLEAARGRSRSAPYGFIIYDI